MTNKELVHKLLEKNNLIIIKGSEDSLDSVMPWLLMDIQYQLFCKYIKPLDCGHSLQLFRTRWAKNYKIFNKSLFCLFTPEEQSDIVDKMAEFEDYIERDVEIARIQFMNAMKFYDIDMQEILATGMMCNILAQHANIVYKAVFHTGPHGKGLENKFIKGVEFNSYEFVNVLHNSFSERHITFSGNPSIETAVKVLSNKIHKWLKEN